MLVRKNRYRKIVRNFSRFFGHKNKITSQRRVYVSGWRFVFASFIIFSIFAYFFPFGRLLNSIKAFGGQTEKINLYANYIQSEETDDFAQGWHNKEKAGGLQDLGPNADMLEFSDENSAFYSGGNFSLIAGNFQFLTEAANKIIENEQAEDILAEEQGAEIVDESADLEDDTESEDEVNSGDEANLNEVDENVFLSDEQGDDNFDQEEETINSADSNLTEEANNIVDDSFVESENLDKPDVTSETTKSEIKDSEETEPVVEPFDNSQTQVLIESIPVVETETEVVGSNESGAEPEAEVIGTDESVAEQVVSYLDKFKKYFIAKAANAQSFVSAEIKTLEDLGTFKSAVINLSLAIHSGDIAGDVIAENMDSPEADTAETGQLESDFDNSLITIWYSLGEQAVETDSDAASNTDNLLWQKLDVIQSSSVSNALNNGYFSFAAPFLESWQDIDNLKIKLEVLDNGRKNLIYLDSVWVESVFERESELDKLKQRQRWEEALDVLSDNLIFKAGEGGELKFQYNKNEERIWETLGEFLGIGNFWKNVDLAIVLFDPSGAETNIDLTTIFESDGIFTVRLPDTLALMPGQYRLKFFIKDSSGEAVEEFEKVQEFYWGVLAMNFNKSEYEAAETGFVQMAVLDDGGHTICNAEVNLEVKDANGDTQIFSTSETDEAKRIVVSKECGPETVTNVPDYSMHYQFGDKGNYEFKLTAKTSAGEKTIFETIEVKDVGAFSVERFGPTRIWPKADYGMKMNVLSREDFVGSIVETVPTGFKISNFQFLISNELQNFQFSIDELENGSQITIKDVNLKAGEVLDINYTFDAPDRSPELYLVGPLSIQIENPKSPDGTSGLDRKSEIENRSWQIASDSFVKRARTVMFQAGVYNDVAGGTGQNTNNDHVLPVFNWKLAESGVTIKNAYVVMETQFEAYNTTGVAYSGYKLGFDACVEDCTAAAFGAGGGQIADDNANALVYDDTESNNGRFLLDVTNEAQISAYTGDGVLMESQFGYRLKNSSAYSSIANASAMLIVTYTYDIDSPNITNTVIYPLDSDTGTNYGSMQAAQAACTADSNCPTFSYNMTLPEWSGVATSSNRVSQWFKMFAAPTANTTTDLRPYLDIQTINNNSSAFHFEEALSGNGSTPPMYFSDWSGSGYAENLAQQTELYVNTTNYVLGGEVTETYIASSSAPVKTRTVSFPMGVISNGNTVALNSQTANVFFPENGSATGTVDIKSAWVRITANGHTVSGTTYTANVSTKTGNNTTTGNLAYQFRSSVAVTSPVLNIIHIIPSSDYTELESATATSGKAVVVNLTYLNALFNGASVELMITYTYSSEQSGYLSSLNLFGGQAASAPATSTVLATANSVFPESANKTLLAAGLRAHYLNSNSSAAMGTTVHLSTANLAIGTPNCGSPAYRAIPDSVNMTTEMLVSVSGAMTTDDNQAYSACYASDNTAITTDSAKMNGTLTYTYGWTNTPPVSSFNSAVFRRDGSGTVDLDVEADDADDHDVRAKLEFATGTTCVFSAPGDPLLDEINENITADFADPYIENDNIYQIGTANGYIKTASGSNSVSFDWLAKQNLDKVEGTYCLRLTANDTFADQSAPATTTVYIDTLPPTSPGQLSLNSRTGTSVTLNFGATTTETNFNEYKIFYKIANGTDPTESDNMWASSSDINLYNKFFNDKSTTTINVSLVGSTTYSFAIWAYDTYGNKASSSRVDIMTNDAPLSSFNTADTKQRNDGSGVVDISLEIDDLNDHNQLSAKLEYALGADCIFAPGLDPLLDENPAHVSADFGLPGVLNENEYQIGNATGWIMTSPGANTINVDWLMRQDEENADSTYCLRLTANDSFDIQKTLATATITLDNVNPTAPGALSSAGVTTNSIDLAYDTDNISSDTNEPTVNAYKVYYKKAESGVTMNDTEIDRTHFNTYDFNGATSTLISGLEQNTWYVFNIWSFDAYGNMSTGTETAIKTSATIKNESLTFVNPRTEGLDTNVAVARPENEWNFRAVVSETNGYFALDTVNLRLANQTDDSSPFSDLVFSWDQTSGVFTEIGADIGNAAELGTGSSADCLGNICTLDFYIVFTKNYLATSTAYAVGLLSTNDSATTDEDMYSNFYQVRYPFVSQTHYRWRNDDGGE